MTRRDSLCVPGHFPSGDRPLTAYSMSYTQMKSRASLLMDLPSQTLTQTTRDPPQATQDRAIFRGSTRMQSTGSTLFRLNNNMQRAKRLQSMEALQMSSAIVLSLLMLRLVPRGVSGGESSLRQITPP